jgi:hypothetical protein
MKKGPDGAESCSRPGGIRDWIHTVLPPLCRTCAFSIRFESLLRPPSLQLDQIVFPRYRLHSVSVPPTPMLRILPAHMISAFLPVRLCSVTKGARTGRTKGWDSFPFSVASGGMARLLPLPSPGSVEIETRYLEPDRFEKLDD